MLSAIKKIVPLSFKDGMKLKLYYWAKPAYIWHSYAQAGEDRILEYFFHSVGITAPTYLDIGTNHPSRGNNTFLFYENGSSGVCVEADPSLHDDIVKARPRDKCLNVGVTFDDRAEADFYVFSVPSLNTLSREEAEFREKNGSYKVEKVIKIPLKNINAIIEENFSRTPDLMSIDVEGIDLAILESLDFDKHRPVALCVETITYSENRTEEKISEILDLVQSKGYLIYADTHINTIFVDEKRFRQRPI